MTTLPVYGQCTDCSIGKSNGETYVAFDREAESLESALQAAVADLKNIGLSPIRVEMDVPAVVPS